MVRPAIACSLLLLSMCEVVFCAPARPQRRVVVESAETAAEAIGGALPGDVIMLKDGAYEDFRLTARGNGTADEPITFRAQNAGQVRFTGDVHIDIAGEHLIVEGFLFDRACGRNIIALSGATHCQLSDCAFGGATSFGRQAMLHPVLSRRASLARTPALSETAASSASGTRRRPR